MISKKLSADFFRPFSDIGKVSLIMTIAKRMQDFGVTADDVVAMAEQEINQRAALLRGNQVGHDVRRAAVKNVPTPAGVCPQCGSGLLLFRVNQTKCTKVGGDYTHMKSCSNRGCNYSELITRR